MNNTLLLLAPAINFVVTGLFAGVVLRQYLARRRSYQLYWSIALCMAFVATLAYIGMLLAHPTSTFGMLYFRIYYALGGSIMPAWLGLGSIALVSNPRITRICLIVLTILSALAAVLVFSANIDMQQLSRIAGTPGTGTLKPGAWLATTIVLNSLGVAAVAGIALLSLQYPRSDRKKKGVSVPPPSAAQQGEVYQETPQASNDGTMNRQRARTVFQANLLIFVGAILNAVAGSLARVLGIQSAFWLIMALGWGVLFTGVLLAGKRPRASNALSPTSNNHLRPEARA